MNKLILSGMFLLTSFHLAAQENKKQVNRIARITIDSTQLENYLSLLREQMETAIRVEPGVISYSVYAEKNKPNELTILEVYAGNAAYLSHRDTPHFQKYKLATKDMVKSLVLSEVDPLFVKKKMQ